MKILEIGGINISFPYEPYECQKAFMQQVIDCLNANGNALLESPTGTGKTLSLLCSVLAYQANFLAEEQLKSAFTPSYHDILDEKFDGRYVSQIPSLKISAPQHLNRKKPIIIYSSRTHSQLTQVLRELRKTIYRPKVNILGSRDQLCRHPDVKKITNNNAQAAICRHLVSKSKCEFYRNMTKLTSHLSTMHTNSKLVNLEASGSGDIDVPDIEEIAKLSELHQACAYYGTREDISNADLILLPYNYLFDLKSSETKICLENSIIIFDEAHNLEGSCLNSVSMEIYVSDLNSCIEEIAFMGKSSQDYDLLPQNNLPIRPDKLKSFLTSLRDFINGNDRVQADIFGILNQCGDGVNMDNARLYWQSLNEIRQKYIEKKYSENKFSNPKSYLQVPLDLFRIVFKDASDPKIEMNDLQKFIENHQLGDGSLSYKIHLVQGEKLCYWCFNPGIVMRELEKSKVKSIILASGTLAPLKPLEYELQIPFRFQLENEHIIRDEHLYAAVVRHGPTPILLSSSFEHRENEGIRFEWGRVILSYLGIIPEGILVFFPSYSLLELCLQSWSKPADPTRPSILSLMKGQKRVFIEPKSKNDLSSILNDYRGASHQGAMFFAVARGKVSEGLDFSEGLCRAAIVIGIPFPPFKDPRVVLKKEYLNNRQNREKSSKIFSSGLAAAGDVWYWQQASRAVNQAIGRVIRNKSDFGAVLLLDCRFSEDRNRSQLSKWIRNHLVIHENSSSLLKDLEHFFTVTHKKVGTHLSSGGQSAEISDTNEMSPILPTLEQTHKSIKRALDFFIVPIATTTSTMQRQIIKEHQREKAGEEDVANQFIDIMKHWDVENKENKNIKNTNDAIVSPRMSDKNKERGGGVPLCIR